MTRTLARLNVALDPTLGLCASVGRSQPHVATDIKHVIELAVHRQDIRICGHLK